MALEIASEMTRSCILDIETIVFELNIDDNDEKGKKDGESSENEIQEDVQILV